MDEKRIKIPGWKIIRTIGKGSFGCVYEVEKEGVFGAVAHSALKVISIPETDAEVKAYRDDGYDDKSLTDLFRTQVEDITAEFELMSKLKGDSHIVSYEDHSIVQHEHDPGYDIFIRMELLTPLPDYINRTFPDSRIPDAAVAALGVDICRALERCGRHNIIHRDIKPQNIFVNEEGDFKLGDFGIAKTSDHTTKATKTGTYGYMAPEVYRSLPYNASVDIYSLGLVLYWMLNERRGPFLPLPPAVPRPSQNSDALDRRMRGETLPAPKNGSEEIKHIVLKACAFNPKERYQSPAEMRRDLERVTAGSGKTPVQPVRTPISAEAYDQTVGAFRKEAVADQTTGITQEPAVLKTSTEPTPAVASMNVPDDIRRTPTYTEKPFEKTVSVLHAEKNRTGVQEENGTVRISVESGAAYGQAEAKTAAHADDADATVGLFHDTGRKPENDRDLRKTGSGPAEQNATHPADTQQNGWEQQWQYAGQPYAQQPQYTQQQYAQQQYAQQQYAQQQYAQQQYAQQQYAQQQYAQQQYAQQQYTQQQQNARQHKQESPKKKTKLGILIGAIAGGVALIAAVVLIVVLLAGKGKDTQNTEVQAADLTESLPAVQSPETGNPEPEFITHDPYTPLVVAYSPFSQKFSPFYADTAYDQDVVNMVGLNLMTTDRMGGIIYNAIEGETVSYNGTDYLYKGPADLSVKYDKEKNQTVYRAHIRDDLKFSDGEPLTADDIIFTYYTYLDPSYVGSTSLSSYDIVGLNEYRTQTTDEVYAKYAELADKIYAAGRTYVENDEYTEEIFNGYWAEIDKAWTYVCQCIVDYCANKYGADNYVQTYFNPNMTWEQVSANDGGKVAFGMAMWGFGAFGEDGHFHDALGNGDWDLVETFPTIEDYYNVTFAKYGGDDAAFFETEKSGNEPDTVKGMADGNFILTWGPKDEAMGGQGVKYIEGIKKLDDYTVEVTVNGYSASAVYSILGITITPMHYYGDKEKYNYEEGKFGFDFGDLSKVQSKTEHPLGAGPYVFVEYKDKVVTFKANPYWFKGEPKIPEIQFKETASAEVATALSTGDADLGEMTGSRTRFEEVASYNSNGEITGDVITTSMVDNPGYGYIGMNADNVNIGGIPGSAESKALRKGLATILAVYRDVAYDSYYGEAASVIQYPISNTSWAAPQPSDPGYRIAFSVDANGNDIYTADMSAEQKYEAAKAGALTWFEAAGYTVEGGKVTAAPEGGRTEFEVIIPGVGQGDHPSYTVLTMAKEALESIGINLIINDPADSNVLWNALVAGTQELWCASWGTAIDPDMYQVYHGNNIVGKGGTDSNHYHINDATLNELIMEARTSDDQTFRKAIYKQCLDIIADWAVEIPAYQRQNCIIFSTKRINISTLTPDITTSWNWMNDIENLEMN